MTQSSFAASVKLSRRAATSNARNESSDGRRRAAGLPSTFAGAGVSRQEVLGRFMPERTRCERPFRTLGRLMPRVQEISFDQNSAMRHTAAASAAGGAAPSRETRVRIIQDRHLLLPDAGTSPITDDETNSAERGPRTAEQDMMC